MHKLRVTLVLIGGGLLLGAALYYYWVWQKNIESIQLMSLVVAGRTKITNEAFQGVAAVRRAAGASIVAAGLGVVSLALGGFKVFWQAWAERSLTRPVEPAVTSSKGESPSRKWVWVSAGVLIVLGCNLLGGYFAYQRGHEGGYQEGVEEGRADASAQYDRGFAAGKAEGLKEGEAKANMVGQPSANGDPYQEALKRLQDRTDPYQEALRKLKEKYGITDLGPPKN